MNHRLSPEAAIIEADRPLAPHRELVDPAEDVDAPSASPPSSVNQAVPSSRATTPNGCASRPCGTATVADAR